MANLLGPPPGTGTSVLGPPPDNRSIGDVLTEGEGAGSPTPREVGTMAKGALEGATSTVTAPLDLAATGGQWIRRHVYGIDEPDYPKLGDKFKQGLEAMGFPKAETPQESAGETAGNLVGGLYGGGLGGGGVAKDASSGTGTTSNWWNWANANGGQNQKLTNNLWARFFGQGGDKLDAATLAATRKTEGAVIDAARNEDKIIQMDPATAHAQVGEINGDLTPTLPGGKGDEILNHSTVQSFLATLGRGYANNDELGSLASRLGASAKTAMQTNPDLGAGLFRVRDIADNLIKEGMNPADIPRYDQALQRWKMLDAMESRPNVLNSTGNLNGGTFANTIQKMDPKGFLEGQNQSPAYNVLRMWQKQLGDNDPSLVGAMNHSQMMTAMKAIARWAPGKLQQVQQVGLPAVLRQVANAPGFATALGQELTSGLPSQSE